MDITMMVALGMLFMAAYTWLLKVGKKRLAYLLPVVFSCLIVGYNVFYNPAPLGPTMIIAAVCGIALLSVLLMIPVAILNRTVK